MINIINIEIQHGSNSAMLVTSTSEFSINISSIIIAAIVSKLRENNTSSSSFAVIGEFGSNCDFLLKITSSSIGEEEILDDNSFVLDLSTLDGSLESRLSLLENYIKISDQIFEITRLVDSIRIKDDTMVLGSLVFEGNEIARDEVGTDWIIPIATGSEGRLAWNNGSCLLKNTFEVA